MRSLQKGGALLRKWTYRKEKRKHYRVFNECRATSGRPNAPHDFLPYQAYSIFHAGGVISPAKDNTNDVAYLVRQGQQEVIEEDDGDRNYVILVVISHPWSQRRRRSMLTSIEVLEI